MPGAGRTRASCVQKKCTLRTQATQGSRTTGTPRAMVYGLYVVSSVCRSFRATVSLRHVSASRIDLSIGRSGPHDFAIRASRVRQCGQLRPSRPAPNVRDVRERPSCGCGMRGDRHVFRKTGSDLFLRGGLDRGDRVEMVREIRFLARRTLVTHLHQLTARGPPIDRPGTEAYPSGEALPCLGHLHFRACTLANSAKKFFGSEL